MSVLARNEDPMGEAIKDHFNGKQRVMIRTFSSIEGEDHLSAAWLFRSREEMPELEKIALINCRGSVLDVGAGAGSHSLVLQELGFKVKAIDVSEVAIETIRKRGVNNCEAIDFMDLPKNAYDTLLFLMNGSGIAGNLKGLSKLLVKAKSLLKKDGQILMDSSDLIYMFEDAEFANSIIDQKGYYGEVTFTMEYEGVKSDPFPWLYIDYFTLSKYAEKAGFEASLVFEGNHFEYLACLVIRE